MTTGRNRALAACLVALAAAVVAPSCYKPNIQDGGLRCTDAGACPEGFHCAPNGTCSAGAQMVCTATSPHVDPLPSCAAAPGTDCDPICQSRCECGRCNMVDGALTCVRPGIKKRGELCNAAADDCVPGNICLNTCGGNQGARCYRFCAQGQTDDHSKCEGNLCDIALNPGGQPEWTLCEPPLAPCNPVGDHQDCDGPATFGCYVGPTFSAVCDCRGRATEGQACGPYNSCVPGFRCVGFGGGSATCFRTCRLGGSDCPPPAVCSTHPGDNTFGFCSS